MNQRGRQRARKIAKMLAPKEYERFKEVKGHVGSADDYKTDGADQRRSEGDQNEQCAKPDKPDNMGPHFEPPYRPFSPGL